MKAAWLHAGIPTVASRGRVRCRLDHQRRAADRALEIMRRGATLHLTHGPAREWWVLSNGWTVSPDVAATLIARPDIQPSATRCSTTRSLRPGGTSIHSKESNHD